MADGSYEVKHDLQNVNKFKVLRFRLTIGQIIIALIAGVFCYLDFLLFYGLLWNIVFCFFFVVIVAAAALTGFVRIPRDRYMLPAGEYYISILIARISHKLKHKKIYIKGYDRSKDV